LEECLDGSPELDAENEKEKRDRLLVLDCIRSGNYNGQG
jgi:hypothetical protein